MREQLARGVGIRPGEEHEALAAELHHRVLEPREGRSATLEQQPGRALVILRLDQMVAECLHEPLAPAMSGASRSCASACSSIAWASER